MPEEIVIPVKKNNKKYVLTGIAFIVAVAALAGYAFYRSSKDIVKEVDPHLDSQQQQERSQIVGNAQNEVRDVIDKNASKEDQFKAYSKLGNELVVVGKYADAADALKSAQKLIPENPTSYQDLFDVYVKMHDYKAAEVQIKKAVELNPASISNWSKYIALEKENLGMSADSRLTLLEMAMSKTNRAPELLYQYGQTYEEKKDLKKAYEIYRELKDKYPEVALYSDALIRVTSK